LQYHFFVFYSKICDSAHKLIRGQGEVNLHMEFINLRRHCKCYIYVINYILTGSQNILFDRHAAAVPKACNYHMRDLRHARK